MRSASRSGLKGNLGGHANFFFVSIVFACNTTPSSHHHLVSRSRGRSLRRCYLPRPVAVPRVHRRPTLCCPKHVPRLPRPVLLVVCARFYPGTVPNSVTCNNCERKSKRKSSLRRTFTRTCSSLQAFASLWQALLRPAPSWLFFLALGHRVSECTFRTPTPSVYPRN